MNFLAACPWKLSWQLLRTWCQYSLRRCCGLLPTLPIRDPLCGSGNLCRFMFQEADLAITDLTITSDREAAVDFTTPFMSLGAYLRFLFWCSRLNRSALCWHANDCCRYLHPVQAPNKGSAWPVLLHGPVVHRCVDLHVLGVHGCVHPPMDNGKVCAVLQS